MSRIYVAKLTNYCCNNSHVIPSCLFTGLKQIRFRLVVNRLSIQQPVHSTSFNFTSYRSSIIRRPAQTSTRKIECPKNRTRLKVPLSSFSGTVKCFLFWKYFKCLQRVPFQFFKIFCIRMDVEKAQRVPSFAIFCTILLEAQQ